MLNDHVTIRLSFFFGMLALIGIWELISPRRKLTTSKPSRWASNLGIVFINTLSVRLLFPLLAIDMAFQAKEKGWGLISNLPLPEPVLLIISLLILDLVIYLQHLMFHAVPLLWRLHMVHHADLDFDVTTGLRFHPLEIIISMIIKITAVAALGPPVPAVMAFEILLNSTAMFNHGNIRLPLRLDTILRFIAVTPDMHRVHHSVTIRETNSNFGFNFPWWDRIFGTYRPQPVMGHGEMTIGIAPYRNPEGNVLHRMLLMPFTGDTGNYSLNRIGGDPEKLKKEISQ